MQCSSCDLLTPGLSLLQLVLYSNEHKETFQREKYCLVSMLWAREENLNIDFLFFFFFCLLFCFALKGSIMFFWVVCLKTQLFASLKREIWVSEQSQAHLPSCPSKKHANVCSRTASPGLLPWGHRGGGQPSPDATEGNANRPKRSSSIQHCPVRVRDLSSHPPVCFPGGNCHKHTRDRPYSVFISQPKDDVADKP